MEASLATLLSLARLTLHNPREGAARVLALALPIPARWAALALMAVLSTLLIHLTFAMQPADILGFFGEALTSPLRMAMLQAVFMLVSVVAIYQIGRWRGGRGRFEDALILVVWLQFLLLGLQTAQLLVSLVLPLLADLIGLATLALFFWWLTNFVAELHGFKSLVLVFVGVLVTLVFMVLVLAFVLAIFLAPQAGV